MINLRMLFALVAMLALSPALAAPPALSDTSAVGLAADLQILERTYKALHPGLYRYNTPVQMDREFAWLGRAWNHDQTLAQAYVSLSEFLAKIKCGHTYANYYNQPDVVVAALFDKPTRVPFTFRWIRRHIVVTQDASAEHAFPTGTEVLAINGVPTEKILAKLLHVARADGGNNAKRIADMDVLANDTYEAFDIFYPLYYPTSAKFYVYTVKRPMAQQPETVTSSPISTLERKERLHIPPTDPAAPAWTLRYPKPDVAELQMPTWEMYNRKWDWKTFLQNAMDEIVAKGTPNLVIDLRGNEGGDSIGDYLLARLVQKQVATEDYQRYTRYRKIPAELKPYLSTWDPSFADWGDSAQPDPNGFFKLTRYDDGKGSVVTPGAHPYRGHVFVLVGPENSSATFEFALQVKRLKLGTLVGRPTGGSQRGINGGAFFFLTLPHSRIEVDVPLIAQFFPDLRPDQGVLPDVPVETIATDIARGRDVEMDRIYTLIR